MKGFLAVIVALCVMPCAIGAAPDVADSKAAERLYARSPDRFHVMRAWRHASVRVDLDDATTIYEIHQNGSVTIYSANAGGDVPRDCAHPVHGEWCVARGRLLRYGDAIVVMRDAVLDGYLYLDRKGRLCHSSGDAVHGGCETPGAAVL